MTQQNEVMELENLSEEELRKLYEETFTEKPVGGIRKGKIVKITPREVIVNVGMKSEGVIPITEFENPEEIKVGDEIDVYVDDIENEEGLAVVSKKKADFLKVWDKIKDSYENERTITARVIRRVKGGLMVNVFGVEAFLPGSQIDTKPVKNMDALVGTNLDVRIIKLNWKRRNIVVSRRIILEEEKELARKKFFSEVKEGDVVEGVVKNVTEFGAFIDLGGVDGLLHVTDMSWGRISHPSEILAIGDRIKVMVIKIDREKERVSLGLKQMVPNPWDGIEERYPPGKRVKGRVISIVDYGAFVELEPGVEGLVHISEMSWSQHIKHPSEVVKLGEVIEAIVLDVDKENQRIALGLRQAFPDPWEGIEKRYPVGSRVKGKITNLTSFGAFVELEEGIEGLLHVSDISWTKKIKHPKEVLKKGEIIECKVLKVDREKRRISLGLKQLEPDPFRIFMRRHPVGSTVVGRVVEIRPKCIVVELEKGLEGIVPMSQLVRRPFREKYNLKERLTLKVMEIREDRRDIVLSERMYVEEEERRKKEEERRAIEEYRKKVEEEWRKKEG